MNDFDKKELSDLVEKSENEDEFSQFLDKKLILLLNEVRK